MLPDPVQQEELIRGLDLMLDQDISSGYATGRDHGSGSPAWLDLAEVFDKAARMARVLADAGQSSATRVGPGGRASNLLAGIRMLPADEPVTVLVGGHTAVNGRLVRAQVCRPGEFGDVGDLVQVTVLLPHCNCPGENDVDPDCPRHESPQPTGEEIAALLPALREAHMWQYGPQVPGQQRGDEQFVNYVAAMLAHLRQPRCQLDAEESGVSS